MCKMLHKVADTLLMPRLIRTDRPLDMHNIIVVQDQEEDISGCDTTAARTRRNPGP